MSVRIATYTLFLLLVRRALQLNPSLPGARFYLGAAHWKLRQYDSAVEAWRQEVKLDPRNVAVIFALGAALGERREAEALLWLEQAGKIRPQHAPTLLYLGKLAWEQKRSGEALRRLEAAVRLDPSIRAARYLLAQVYRSQGQAEKAKVELEAVRRLTDRGVREDIDILQGAAAGTRR